MSGPSIQSSRAVEKVEKGKEVEHTLDDNKRLSDAAVSLSGHVRGAVSRCKLYNLE